MTVVLTQSNSGGAMGYFNTVQSTEYIRVHTYSVQSNGKRGR